MERFGRSRLREVVGLAAAILLSAAFGSIHSFSVLLEPFEVHLEVSRGRASLVYAVALVALTGGVRLYGVAPAKVRFGWWLPLLAALLAAVGLTLSVAGTNWWTVVLGFGVVFGTANGVAYAAALELGAHAVAQRSAMAMALVTAAYALGATGAALLLDPVAQRVGVDSALAVLGIGIVVAGLTASIALHRRPVVFSDQLAIDSASRATDGDDTHHPRPGPSATARLWCYYGLVVTGGLMTIAHASEILRALESSEAARRAGVALVTAANAGAGLGVAAVVLRQPPARVLRWLAPCSVVALVALAAGPNPAVALAALVVVGGCYGAFIAAFPAAVLHLVGPREYASLYGRVFTAWGAGGLVGPFLAGGLFDRSGSYRLPLLIAAGAGVLAATMNNVWRT